LKSCCVLQDDYDDELDKTVFHNTTPDLQDQDRFVWFQTGLVLRPTVSDHITDLSTPKSILEIGVHPANCSDWVYTANTGRKTAGPNWHVLHTSWRIFLCLCNV